MANLRDRVGPWAQNGSSVLGLNLGVPYSEDSEEGTKGGILKLEEIEKLNFYLKNNYW